MTSSIYDVAIIGGGPAGSTAAALLARSGRRVILFEREKFPRFHIGESLLPYSMPTFERLVIRDLLDHTFLHKHGAELNPARSVAPPSLRMTMTGAPMPAACTPCATNAAVLTAIGRMR